MNATNISHFTWLLGLQRGLFGAAVCGLWWLAGCDTNSPADWSALKNGQQVTVRLKGTDTAIYVDATTPQ